MKICERDSLNTLDLMTIDNHRKKNDCKYKKNLKSDA